MGVDGLTLPRYTTPDGEFLLGLQNMKRKLVARNADTDKLFQVSGFVNKSLDKSIFNKDTFE